MIIDTHCHLDDERFYKDLREVIDNSFNNGIGGIIIPGTHPKDFKRARCISHSYERIYYAVGVHPYNIDDFNEYDFIEFLEDKKCIAIGECGLDYYRLPDDEEEKNKIKEEQKRVFVAQINIAKKYKKPLIVHIRDANQDSFDILKEHSNGLVGGVLHCYNACEMLLKLSDDNFYFGIGGVVTFSNAKKLVDILPKIPKDKLLIETDAPYLTPHPFRGKRNEPLYTKFVLEKMAHILDISSIQLENMILENTKSLFKEYIKHF